MKKNLNLYHQSCQPKKIIFNFSQLTIVLVACILLTGLIQTLLIHRASSMEDNKAMAAEKLLVLQDNLSMLVVKMQANRAPQSKVYEKEKLTREVAAKRHLLSNLEQIDLGLVVSFSELMLGLSKADIEQVSINKFSIRNGKLNIEGKASKSDSVPLWLTNIQSTTELHAVSFRAVNITEKENAFLFKLTNVGLKAASKGRK